MGAGDADALLVQAAHITQQNAALDSGDAVGGSGIQLHVIFGNGGRVDYHVGADHIIGGCDPG